MSVLLLLAGGLVNLQSFCCCFRIADGLEVRVGLIFPETLSCGHE